MLSRNANKTAAAPFDTFRRSVNGHQLHNWSMPWTEVLASHVIMLSHRNATTIGGFPKDGRDRGSFVSSLEPTCMQKCEIVGLEVIGPVCRESMRTACIVFESFHS